MTRMKYIIGVSLVCLSLSLAGTAFASADNTGSPTAIGTEAGNWEHRFDASPTKASKAASNHAYDAEALAAIGTEAGNWEFRFDAPATKASKAASNYAYDAEALAGVGTEAGNWQFSFASPDASGSEVLSADSNKVDAGCKC